MFVGSLVLHDITHCQIGSSHTLRIFYFFLNDKITPIKSLPGLQHRRNSETITDNLKISNKISKICRFKVSDVNGFIRCSIQSAETRCISCFFFFCCFTLDKPYLPVSVCVPKQTLCGFLPVCLPVCLSVAEGESSLLLALLEEELW